MHICYGYGIQANLDWKKTLGDQWRQYETVFPVLARSSIDQVSLECLHSHVPPDLMALLAGKDVMVGVIDVASDAIETPETVAETITNALRFVPRERLIACTNCGMAPMDRAIALAKIEALVKGAALARRKDMSGATAPRPPLTPPADVHARLARDGHVVVDATSLATLCGVHLADLAAWRRYWDDLPSDRYLRDGGHYPPAPPLVFRGAQ